MLMQFQFKNTLVFILTIGFVAMMLFYACEERRTVPDGDVEEDFVVNRVPPAVDIAECAKNCADVIDPVCGVDGQIYSNVCIAKCTGTEIDPEGRCAVCEKSLESYQAEGLQKVKTLNEYISVILGYSKKDGEENRVNTSIEEALNLFVSPESSQVAVTGVSTKYFTIRDYLDRIKNYSYGRVDIVWTEIGYVSQLKKGTDGNYYGTITVTQQFAGYSEDKTTPQYIDVTEKNIEIVLRVFTINDRGRIEVDCEVLLGDIGVKDVRTYP
ncbi:MAG: Kazal-type serine protease inhibitor family protein [Bacteroidia bacterium]